MCLKHVGVIVAVTFGVSSCSISLGNRSTLSERDRNHLEEVVVEVRKIEQRTRHLQHEVSSREDRQIASLRKRIDELEKQNDMLKEWIETLKHEAKEKEEATDE